MTRTKKLTKTELMVAEYLTYAKNVNVHQKPTKGTHSGAYGNSFEHQIKLALGNKHFKGTSPRGRIDTIKKINGEYLSFEIKQGCGELAVLDKNGKIIRSCFNTKYMIFCPDFDINRPVVPQSYIIDTKVFIDLLIEIGLVRKKTTSSMYNKPVIERFHNRLAIQSYLNSEKKTNQFYDKLEEKGISLGEWLDINIYNKK